MFYKNLLTGRLSSVILAGFYPAVGPLYDSCSRPRGPPLPALLIVGLSDTVRLVVAKITLPRRHHLARHLLERAAFLPPCQLSPGLRSLDVKRRSDLVYGYESGGSDAGFSD